MYNDTQNLECSVAGAVCIEPRIVSKLLGKISPDDFQNPVCGQILEAAFTADARGQPFDHVLAAEAIKPRAGIDAQRFVLECMELTPTVHNAELHASLIRKAARKRALTAAVQAALDEVDDPDETAARISGICRGHLGGTGADRTRSISSALMEIYETMGQKQLRIDTGFPKTDAILKGMWGGNLCVLGARPGVGKTAFALSLAAHAARSGHKCLVYSLEMLTDEVVERLLAQNGVSMDELIEASSADKAVWGRINKASAAIAGLPLLINDDPSVTVSRIRMQAMQIPDLHMIVVDFLTLMRSERRYDNRNLEIGAMTRELKLLAAELQIPILALAQLSRNRDEDEQPTLRDLRDSGEIEQNANKVMLLWNADRETGKVGLYIAKNRRGGTGRVCFRFDGAHMSFVELPHEIPQQKRKQQRLVFADG